MPTTNGQKQNNNAKPTMPNQQRQTNNAKPQRQTNNVKPTTINNCLVTWDHLLDVNNQRQITTAIIDQRQITNDH